MEVERIAELRKEATGKGLSAPAPRMRDLGITPSMPALWRCAAHFGPRVTKEHKQKSHDKDNP